MITRAEAWAYYLRASSYYDEQNYYYTFYSEQQETAQNKRRVANEKLTASNKNLVVLKKRCSELDAIKALLEDRVTECINKASSTADNAGDCYKTTFSGTTVGEIAQLGEVFTTMSIEQDSIMSGVYMDCSQERNRTKYKIESTENEIATLSSRITTLDNTIQQCKSKVNEATRLRTYWRKERDESLALYQRLP